METAAISYRVVDFLKKHAPFQAIADDDLLELAGLGRVRLFEENEYILCQGASRFEILVIQQGTVSLWDEGESGVVLCDIRGAGDMLGIDQYDQVRSHPYSAKSASDSLVYAFPTEAFLDLMLKYSHAERFIGAYGAVTADFQPTPEKRNPQDIFLHELVARKTLVWCDSQTTIRDAAHSMLTSGVDAMAVLDSERQVCGLITARSFIQWIQSGAGDIQQPVQNIMSHAPRSISPTASVTEATLAMADAHEDAWAMTSTGRSDGQLVAVVTPQDLAKVFGDQPGGILNDIRRASGILALRELNQRVRAFALQYLTGASSVEWISDFVALADAGIVRRIISLTDSENPLDCWCFFASAARQESAAGAAPHVLLIFGDGSDEVRSRQAHRRVCESIVECGYLQAIHPPFEESFYAAHLNEWETRYEEWVRDPVFKQMYQAHSLFDLRRIQGPQTPVNHLESTVARAVDRDFLYVLANDCLSSLPPLTFFQNAVVEESGGHTEVFRLEDTALRPLVDVGRVFGLASKKGLAASTLDRFATARALLPEHESIFREAAETLRVLLWQQGRVGISQRTTGSELPPALLSRYDRHVLRSGFRSIHRLLEFTADMKWIENL